MQRAAWHARDEEIAAATQRAERAERERDEARADRDRYRWLRDDVRGRCLAVAAMLSHPDSDPAKRAAQADVAIDAAIAAAGGHLQHNQGEAK